MVQNTVSNQFSAALGVEHQMNKAVENTLLCFYRDMLHEYRKEIRYERARLMRQAPLDYRAVRGLDHALEDAAQMLSEMELDAQRRDI